MNFKKISLLVLLFLTVKSTFCQNLQTNFFVRSAYVTNYNISNKALYFTPAIATGIGLAHKSKFIELGSFVNKDNKAAIFTFFGSTINSRILDESWKLHTNWFGETTLFPSIENNKTLWINTVGLSFFLNKIYKWGSFGIPLTIGVANSKNSLSINTRAIMNLSFKLNKPQ